MLWANKRKVGKLQAVEYPSPQVNLFLNLHCMALTWFLSSVRALLQFKRVGGFLHMNRHLAITDLACALSSDAVVINVCVQWKFLLLPYNANPLLLRVFHNCERARTWSSLTKNHGGLFASVNDVTNGNLPIPSYISATGVQEVITAVSVGTNW